LTPFLPSLHLTSHWVNPGNRLSCVQLCSSLWLGRWFTSWLQFLYSLSSSAAFP